MGKNKDDARAEGYQRGLTGKSDAAGITQGWTDDRAAGEARGAGYAAGKREHKRLAAQTRGKL